MTRKHLVLIKLGGGLITDKATPFTIRKEPIALFAQELKQVREENDDVDFVIGNGAGSFGHFTAHQYHLRGGARTPEQMYGMCLTHNGVRQLNGIVADALTAQNIPAFALSPSAMIACDDGEVVADDFSSLKAFVAGGCVPLVHGDTISDATKGTTIMSTEEVLHRCMLSLGGGYEKVTVIYLLDVDGLLDHNGAVISTLNADEKITTLGQFEHDVTGGITAKVQSARKAAAHADNVYFIGGKVSGALGQAIRGQSVGTKIL